jgi:hypothetical protein
VAENKRILEKHEQEMANMGQLLDREKQIKRKMEENYTLERKQLRDENYKLEETRIKQENVKMNYDNLIIEFKIK